MDKTTEVQLIGELRELAQDKRCFLDEQVTTNGAYKYFSEAHFRAEQETILRDSPQIVAHASELANPDSFLRRQVAGLPLLLTRDSVGEVHAFLNVCRHRGTRLVDDERGCRGRFTCPYHAWSWNTRGELLKIPFGDEGFPDVDTADLGLRRLPCVERFGWIWLSPNGSPLDLNQQLAGLEADFDWLDAGSLEIKASDTNDRTANWKLLIEGGLEAYHFRIVHRNTIGPHFPNNLSSYQEFGDNLRSILPRAGIGSIDPETMPASSIREHANILYSVLPLSQILVMQDHLVWILMQPLSAGLTRVTINTVAPKDSDDAAHWKRNHGITVATLTEDSDIAESIQSVIESGANDVFQFGRFEGALAKFNAAIDRRMAG